MLVSLQENLTEALADLDAALEKELSRDCEHDLAALQTEESTTKVEELEKQCKTLETELDSVKGLLSISLYLEEKILSFLMSPICILSLISQWKLLRY